MKRSIFFLITSIIGALLGAMMLFTPAKAAESFGLETSPAINMMFGIIGGMLLGVAFLNFMVRNHGDSATLKTVLMTNIVLHAISICTDLVSVSNGVLEFSKIVPAIVIHLFVGIGAIIYAMKIKSSI